MFKITHLDHLVLTVTDIPTSLEFYSRVLGMYAIQFGENRTALTFGQQKINLHQVDQLFEPHAQHAIPGSEDICLVTDTPLKEVIDYITVCKVKIIDGPVERTGAMGKLLSIYIRDPDQNLIEIANQI